MVACPFCGRNGAETFFQAFRVSAHGKLALDRMNGFAIPVVAQGSGELHAHDGTHELHAGETWIIPYAAGTLEVRGEIDGVLCMPPAVAPSA